MSTRTLLPNISSAVFVLLAVGFTSGCDDGTCRTASDCESTELCEVGMCTPKSTEPPPSSFRPPPAVWEGKQTGFLWRVEGASPTYLLGTIHVGVDPAGFPQRVFSAFDASPLIAIEADITRTVDEATIDRYRRLPQGTRLDALFPPDVWVMLVDSLTGFVTEAELRTFEPWYVSLLVGDETSDLPEMEPVLLQRAARQQRPVGFLETAEDQFSALQRIPREYFVEIITAYLRDPSASGDEFRRLVSAYLQADADTIAMVALGDARSDDILLRERNENWIPQIETWHATGGAFVAVGLAHLLGPGSVVELLRTRGSTVTPVRLDGMALTLEREPDLAIELRDVAPIKTRERDRPDLRWPLF